MNQLVRASIRTVARLADMVPFGHSLVSGLEVYFAQVQGIGYVASMEEESRAAARCVTSAAPVVLDAGANRGEWTVNFLKTASPQARIYAFDPSATNVAELRQIRDERITVVPQALADFQGTSKLYTPSPGCGMGSLFNFRESSSGPTAILDEEAVEVTTLDAFIEENKLTSIDFMKMDMEGAEYAALQGGMRSLRAGVIRALSFEFGQCNIASKTYLLDFWYLLNDLSFSLNLIGPNGMLVPIPEYSPRYEIFRHSNFIAILNGPGFRRTRYLR